MRDEWVGTSESDPILVDVLPQEAESERFEGFVCKVVSRLESGKNVVVHCRGGLGRTGVVAAGVLVALGKHGADDAIRAVRGGRRGTVQTEEQADFVRRFEAAKRAGGEA